MEQVIIYTTEQGNVAVCIPTGEVPIEQVLENDIPMGVEKHIVDKSSLPWENKDFFNAWELSGTEVIVSMSKARELAKDAIREKRVPLLAALDVQFQRALETGADTSVIVAEKQKLRDLPLSCDGANTLDELRALLP